LLARALRPTSLQPAQRGHYDAEIHAVTGGHMESMWRTAARLSKAASERTEASLLSLHTVSANAQRALYWQVTILVLFAAIAMAVCSRKLLRRLEHNGVHPAPAS
jgi:hypothetical protein